MQEIQYVYGLHSDQLTLIAEKNHCIACVIHVVFVSFFHICNL